MSEAEEFLKLYTRFSPNLTIFSKFLKNPVFCDKAFCRKIKITYEDFFVVKHRK